jgi:hypothetical protein
MRTLSVLIVVTFFLLSCQKEAGAPDTNNNGSTDTTALGKFVKATGVTDQLVKASLDSLITNARNHNWWSLCKAIYPLVGGTSESCKFNLKDPRDDDAAYRVTWNGNVTFDETGVISTGGYGDTHIVPSSALTLSSNHISYYSSTDAFDTASVDAGAGDGPHTIQLRIYSGLNQGWYQVGAAQAPFLANTGLTGWFLGTRTGPTATDAALYKNGSKIDIGSANNGDAEGLPGTYTIALLNFNNAGVFTKSSNRKCAFVTIGSGIDSAMAVTMYNDIQAFQVALAREAH